MISGWMLIWLLVAQCGLPLLAVGVIVRLCEGSWGKRRGELGSNGILLGGCLFFLPLVLCVLVNLFRVKLLP